MNIDGQMVLSTYGRSSGFCVDPVEKKPLNHFYPGSPVLSFGTAGCNLTCKFCQNWDIARSKEFDRLSDTAGPEAIARAASRYQCKSVALTYNEPVIFLEYGQDVAEACHRLGVQVVAVSNGYIQGEARREFFNFVDAANIDLKAFSEDFYQSMTGGDLKTVLDTLVYIKHDTSVWLEITTLLIPGKNDSETELRRLSNWVMNELGPDVPVHFSAFHPDFKMMDIGPTPVKTLIKARNIAMEAGLRFVYTGNVVYAPGDTTFCPACQWMVIEREWYRISNYSLDSRGNCGHCGTAIPGRFDLTAGDWGAKRQPIRIG